MSYQVVWTSKFKKDYKHAIKKGLNIELLDNAIRLLAENGNLSEFYHDHALKNNWNGFRECHIEPDWLLVYAIRDDVLILTLARTGSHSDLF